ncbi:peptidoglycan DD-metalloendopeptidase family protein [Pollutibacter soli]|uniref:peptidoglycan DD-metalloendopeptidase family protein n=1 Tax=Pollutibacter soli TaxID=3034157 RepID=UPI003AF7F4F1
MTDNPKISSFWGADRDGGIRKHEGVDIFAKKRTPLVAAANGTITRVNENNLGGKVIFLRPHDKSYSLYYAHLDSQIATQGQKVKTGDIIGLMGNTGNAKTTPPHLHFGIYTRNGAVDPFPFIERDRKMPAPVISDKKNLNELMHANAESTVFTQPDIKSGAVTKVKDSDLMEIVGATDEWYRVLVNDSVNGFIPEKLLSSKPLQKKTISKTGRLLHSPDVTTAALKLVAAGSTIEILGRRGNFFYVKDKSDFGWFQNPDLLTTK